MELLQLIDNAALHGEIVRVVVVKRNLMPVIEMHRSRDSDIIRTGDDLIGKRLVLGYAGVEPLAYVPCPVGDALSAVFVVVGRIFRLIFDEIAVKHSRVVPVAVERLPYEPAAQLLTVGAALYVGKRHEGFYREGLALAGGIAAELLCGGRGVVQTVIYAEAVVSVKQGEVLHGCAV